MPAIVPAGTAAFLLLAGADGTTVCRMTLPPGTVTVLTLGSEVGGLLVGVEELLLFGVVFNVVSDDVCLG